MTKFHIEGSRCGWVNFREGERVGRFEWELLVGEFQMVLYACRSYWLAPSEERLSAEEVSRLAQEFADESGFPLKVDAGSGCRAVYPASAHSS